MDDQPIGDQLENRLNPQQVRRAGRALAEEEIRHVLAVLQRWLQIQRDVGQRQTGTLWES